MSVAVHIEELERFIHEMSSHYMGKEYANTREISFNPEILLHFIPKMGHRMSMETPGMSMETPETHRGMQNFRMSTSVGPINIKADPNVSHGQALFITDKGYRIAELPGRRMMSEYDRVRGDRSTGIEAVMGVSIDDSKEDAVKKKEKKKTFLDDLKDV